jgi:nucleotide-binding universal stress UspA family protein
MNKIVVAIDFSDCSINAFRHAQSIADNCNGELILVWVEKGTGEKEKFVDKVKDASKDVQAAFEDLIAKYRHEHPDVIISWKIRKGKIYKEITDEARTCNAMMIITGTHGASGFEEFWIGSNANKIVSASSCPVITIRGGINVKRPLQKIVLPIDSAEETRQKASLAAYMALNHEAEIFVLKLYTSKLKEMMHRVDTYADQVCEYFTEEGVKFSVDMKKCENISDATIEYAKSIDANLIVVMTEQETTTSNIFLGPYAHQIVNHSPIPVMSIHPKETLTASQGF